MRISYCSKQESNPTLGISYNLRGLSTDNHIQNTIDILESVLLTSNDGSSKCSVHTEATRTLKEHQNRYTKT